MLFGGLETLEPCMWCLIIAYSSYNFFLDEVLNIGYQRIGVLVERVGASVVPVRIRAGILEVLEPGLAVRATSSRG